MQVGDLVKVRRMSGLYKSLFDEAGDHTIRFTEVGKTAVLDSHMIQFVEAVSESR